MLIPLIEINNCYILQKPVGQDSCTEHWLASAIFSPNKFLIRFVKEGISPKDIIERYRMESMRCYSFKGSAFSDFIEIEYFQDRLFIASEYHGKGILSQANLDDRAGDIDLYCSVILNLANGIDRLHERRMIFGSLTPENIEIFSDGKNAFDYRIRTPGYFILYQALQRSRTEAVVDKSFLAPETLGGKKSERTADIYSLGVALAWLLTGPLPVKDSSFPANLPKEFEKKHIPEALSRIVHKSIQQEPQDRFQNCTDFIEEVKAYQQKAQKERDAAGVAVSGHNAGIEVASERAPHAVLPVASPRRYVLEYFQDVSADYFSSPRKYTENNKPEELLRHEPVLKNAAPSAAPIANPNIGYFAEKAAGIDVPLESSRPSETPSVVAGGIESPAETQILPQIDVADSLDIAHSERYVEKAKPADEEGLTNVGGHAEASSPRKVPIASASWKYRRVALDEISPRLMRSVRRARNGQGAVHYLGEPDSIAANKLVDDLLDHIKKESLFLDLGSFLRFGKADVKDFLRAFRATIAVAISDELPFSLTRFSRIIQGNDAQAFFGAPPLGRILYGGDNAECAMDASDWHSVIAGMAVFGRKKKPLVIVIRGCESFQPELTAFFNKAVPMLKEKPVCLFLFRKDFPAIMRTLGVIDAYS